MEAKDTIIDGMQFLKIAHDGGLDAAAKAQAEISFKAGIREVIRMYAWWQDGVQFVGTTGRTLKDALLEYELE